MLQIAGGPLGSLPVPPAPVMKATPGNRDKIDAILIDYHALSVVSRQAHQDNMKSRVLSRSGYPPDIQWSAYTAG